MKNSRHKGHRFGQIAFYPPPSWPSIKKKTLSPAPYAPPRLKHSRTTRELVCRLCAPLFPSFYIHADKRSFSLLVSRDESRNEAPSIVQLIFRNFSKKERKRNVKAKPLPRHLLKLTPNVAGKREASQKRATRAKKSEIKLETEREEGR